MGKLIDVAATLVSIGAGIYLLSTGGGDIPGGGQSWFEVIAHGMGAYFIAKGLWMARSLHLQSRLVDETAPAKTHIDTSPITPFK